MTIHLFDQFDIYTNYELSDFEYFPKPTSKLYLSRKTLSSTKPNEYMIELYLAYKPFFVVRRRIDAYIKHYEEEGWDDGPYPTVLLVCPTKNYETKALEYIENAKDSSFMDETDIIMKTYNVADTL
jgi:hypothetical protein